MKNLNKIHFNLVVANESMSHDVILGRDFMDACNLNLNLDTFKMVRVENIENPSKVSDEKQIVSDDVSNKKQIVSNDVSNVSDEKQIVSDVVSNVRDKNTIFSDVNHGISDSRETIKEIFSKIRDDEKVTDKNYIEPEIRPGLEGDYRPD